MWTKEVPKEPGFYWFRYPQMVPIERDDNPTIVRMLKSMLENGPMSCAFPGNDYCCRVDDPQLLAGDPEWWSIPISPPGGQIQEEIPQGERSHNLRRKHLGYRDDDELKLAVDRGDPAGDKSVASTPGASGPCVGCSQQTGYLCPFCTCFGREYVRVCGKAECREKHELQGCIRTETGKWRKTNLRSVTDALRERAEHD